MMHPSQEEPAPEMVAATALVDALSALRRAEQAIQVALAYVQGRTPPRDIKASAAVRTTGVQVLHALSQAPHPITLQDVADAVVAIRRGEDEPRKGGGTRYQEMCRTALVRLIERGLVVRVEPAHKSERMRFRRAS